MKTIEQIHEEYKFLSGLIHTSEVDGEYTTPVLEQLGETLFAAMQHLPKNDDTLENAGRCIESLTETIELVMGWLKIDLINTHRKEAANAPR